ncbi:hypothetical protein N0U24_11250 [Peribacillus frigoritolerans]|uniref:hypothetical protein n=1 Tax=Peribacillus frigoritolerans TaxID=450367 RepID=UPI0021A9DF5C|nr:hypothetical protein [Peribacillus frigoritolerans]MCT4477729.1 hypothetical protein [Peribacillus frigoritolerans]
MISSDILTNIGTFIAGCVAGGGFTFLSINKNNSKSNSNNKVTQTGNTVHGDLTGGSKNEK